MFAAHGEQATEEDVVGEREPGMKLVGAGGPLQSELRGRLCQVDSSGAATGRQVGDRPGLMKKAWPENSREREREREREKPRRMSRPDLCTLSGPNVPIVVLEGGVLSLCLIIVPETCSRVGSKLISRASSCTFCFSGGGPNSFPVVSFMRLGSQERWILSLPLVGEAHLAELLPDLRQAFCSRLGAFGVGSFWAGKVPSLHVSIKQVTLFREMLDV